MHSNSTRVHVHSIAAAAACGLAIICGSSSVQPVKATSVATRGDFTGDGKADHAVYDRVTGLWSVEGLGSVGWKGDVPVPADYDGDGKTDFALWCICIDNRVNDREMASEGHRDH
jgi:hypothetical protein